MSNQIRMTPDQMRGRAGEYSAQADAVGEIIAKMDSLLEALQGEWEGKASEAYVARYTELKPAFQKAETLIREISTALTDTANIVEEADSNIASQFNG